MRVNLTRGEVTVEHPEEQFYRTYLGGRGLIAYYLLKEVPAGADPLGPDNKVIFAAGPVTGAPIAGSGRNSVGAKSPLTGFYGDGEGGGFFGAELKRAGFDAVIVEGMSASPVYLWLHDGEYELRDASHLWGKETLAVERAIKDELGDQHIRVAQIGVAGERLVRYANVVNDLTHFCGRGGIGAVLGAKKLKAIAVRGTKALPLADKDALAALARYQIDNFEQLSAGFKDTGTAGGVISLNAGGGLPTRNFSEGSFEGAERISGQTMRDTILVDRDNCFACPIFCKRVVKVDQPYQVDPVYGGPEYETIGSLGSSCGIDDLPAIAKGNELCNKYGLDTISTGVTIAFAMEAFEKGLITAADSGGIELKFGNAQAMLAMIELIARREGFGRLLGEGSLRAARAIGKGAEEFAIQVKGQEVPMHEPRMKFGLGVGYAVSPTGADHCHNIHDTGLAKETGIKDLAPFGIISPVPVRDLGPEKVRMLTYISNWRHMANCGVYCYFVPWGPNQVAEMFRAVTGWNTSVMELMKVGERAVTLCRLFNLREGLTDEDDKLTPRFTRAFRNGPLEGVFVPEEQVEKAKRLYYGMMGWSEQGVPTEAKLGELGISWALAALADRS
ncbi:MAG: aldehyde ferredoxin oxidoreductase family protein [Chloroflexota bacterium]